MLKFLVLILTLTSSTAFVLTFGWKAYGCLVAVSAVAIILFVMFSGENWNE